MSIRRLEMTQHINKYFPSLFDILICISLNRVEREISENFVSWVT